MMASLTPGVLQKLLQNVDNEDVKVVGEHRSALLQVIGIVPSLEDDPWKSTGFYMRVSDSVHSAYVSVPDEDVDLILSDKIQLGQFIHVTRLDSGSPVPVLRGLKPVPKRRTCVGNPKDLISSDCLTVRKNVDAKNGKKKAVFEKKVQVKENPKGKIKTIIETEDVKTRRLSLSNAKVQGLETRRLSLDSARKEWDRSSLVKDGTKAVSKSKLKDRSLDLNSVLSSKKIDKEDSASKLSSISPLKSKNVIVSPRSLSKPIKKDLEKPNTDSLPAYLKKVGLSYRNWSDSKILWTSLPPTILDSGKEVKGFRNASFLSAVHALEEASAAEGIIYCMSKFAELCDSSQKDSARSVVEQFLNLHENMQKSVAILGALLETGILEAKSINSFSSQHPLPEICNSLANKNALSWVQAAVETDLSRFLLFKKEGTKGNQNNEKCFYVVTGRTPEEKETESPVPKNKRSPGIADRTMSNSNTKAFPSNSRRLLSITEGKVFETEKWTKGNGLKDSATLAEKLLLFSRRWFLSYLENLLVKGLEPRTGEPNSETEGILGQLKRVNRWLDDSFPRGSGVDERIDDLRKKLYGFLLDHVDCSIGSER